MRFNFLQRAMPLMACAFFLNACGGGNDDEVGGALTISPTQVTLAGPRVTTTPAVCPNGGTNSTQVFVYGGVAPYRLDNTQPDLVTLSQTVVNHRNESFTINSFGGGCYGPILINVVDSLNHQVTLEFTTVPGEVAS